MDVKDVLEALGISVLFFVVVYAFVSIMTGISLHLQPTGFNILIIGTILGTLIGLIDMYIRGDEENECDE